jgi:hypothetical protein
MNREQALQSAQVLAAYYGAAIGECLVANQVTDTQLSPSVPAASAWLVCFDIVGGPRDWCWVAIVSPARDESIIYASNVRPNGRRATASRST